MAKLGRYTKAPGERKRYEIDYSDWLDTNEVVNQVTFAVAVNTGTPPDAPSPLSIDASSIGNPATNVVFFASLGDDGVQYKVTVIITTSGGQVKEDVVLFDVREP